MRWSKRKLALAVATDHEPRKEVLRTTAKASFRWGLIAIVPKRVIDEAKLFPLVDLQYRDLALAPHLGARV